MAVSTIENVSERRNSSLSVLIDDRIRRFGSISFEEYMSICLNGGITRDGEFIPGFYSRDITIGDRDGILPQSSVDFYTSPETSPVFGFLIAKQVLEIRERMGSPENFTIVEMGAGNGTLAHDILYGIGHFDPQVAINYLIVEKSPALIYQQQDRLRMFRDRVKIARGSADSLPLGDNSVTGVFLSNELLDDLPTHIVRKASNGWETLYIGGGDSDKFSEIWKECPDDISNFLQHLKPEVDEGELYPCNIRASELVKRLSQVLKRGYIITFDYGLDLKDPRKLYASQNKGIYGSYLTKATAGIGNLTCHVDFQALADIGVKNGLRTEGFVTQAGFLFGLGFHERRKELRVRFPDGRIGERAYDFYRDPLLLRTGIGVLIQSKGVNQNYLSGLQYVFHDEVSDNQRSLYLPLKKKTPQAAGNI